MGFEDEWEEAMMIGEEKLPDDRRTISKHCKGSRCLYSNTGCQESLVDGDNQILLDKLEESKTWNILNGYACQQGLSPTIGHGSRTPLNIPEEDY